MLDAVDQRRQQPACQRTQCFALTDHIGDRRRVLVVRGNERATECIGQQVLVAEITQYPDVIVQVAAVGRGGDEAQTAAAGVDKVCRGVRLDLDRRSGIEDTAVRIQVMVTPLAVDQGQRDRVQLGRGAGAGVVRREFIPGRGCRVGRLRNLTSALPPAGRPVTAKE